MSDIYSWDITAANNSNADSAINWAENQTPGTVNNSARAMMGRVAEFVGDIGGTLTAGGTANALTVTANSAFTAYADGQIVSFKASADNSAAATLNVNAVGAKAIRKMTSAGEGALASGDIKNGYTYVVRYSSTANSAAGAWLVDWAPSPVARIDYVPVGMVSPYAGTTEPTGWLFCYGQAISRTTYATLFTALSTTYGVGDGSTTFNLPDLRGRVVAGQDDMGGSSANRLTSALNGDTLGASGGDETHTLTTAQLATHSHGVGTLATAADGGHAHNIGMLNNVAPNANATPGSSSVQGTGAAATTNFSSASVGDHTHTITGSTANAGSGSAHNNVQPTFILNYIIFAGVE